MAAQTALIPGVGFVQIDTTQTAVIPGVGIVQLDGTAGNIPATVNISAGLGATSALATASVGAKANVSITALSASTSALGTATATTTNVKTIVAGVKAYIGARAVNDFITERAFTAGIAGELSGSVEGGLPVLKSVSASITARVGSRGLVTRSRAATQGITARIGARVRITHTADIAGTGVSVVRSAAAKTGARALVGGVVNKIGDIKAYAAPKADVIGTASNSNTGGGGGTSGDLTQTTITNIVNQVLAALNTTPPAGLVTAVASEAIANYRNDFVEDDITRVEAERLILAGVAGESFGMEAPPGAFIPAPGTTRGYYNQKKTKARIVSVSDGTPNRKIQSTDTTDG